jgi:hypothetical protein
MVEADVPMGFAKLHGCMTHCECETQRRRVAVTKPQFFRGY